MKDLKDLVRPNVWNMKPYSSARDEFQGNASVFLDANENPFNRPYNRYPDPLQWELKKKIAEIKGVKRESIFLGNGSDEPIDLIIRAFCEPSIDSIVSIAPSYGMYEVAANVNNVEFRKIKLDEKFDLDTDSLLEAANDWVKVIFLCSPNNPTGNNLSRDRLYKVLNTFQGIVVIDEAYVDFSIEPSFLGELEKFPNLIVLQTMSKAWGAAGIRLGMAFASPEIIAILNKIKYPYNVNLLTQERALYMLENKEQMEKQLRQYLANDTASFGRSVRSVIDGTEYYLVASTRMDGVHIVDKGFHRLMHAADSFIDGMLDDTFVATQSFERTIHIVIQFLLVEM